MLLYQLTFQKLLKIIHNFLAVQLSIGQAERYARKINAGENIYLLFHGVQHKQDTLFYDISLIALF